MAQTGAGMTKYFIDKYYLHTNNCIYREGDWFWMNSLRPVGDFVWWQTQPNGGLDENCMYCTVDAGISFWDVPCDDEYYPVCQINAN